MSIDPTRPEPIKVVTVVRFPKEKRPGCVPGFRITNVFLFTCVDDDDTEGIIGQMSAAGWMPFVCADSERVESLREHAQLIATSTGKTVKISRYSVREDIEEIKPQA